MAKLDLLSLLGFILLAVGGFRGVKDFFSRNYRGTSLFFLMVFLTTTAVICGGVGGVQSLYLSQALDFALSKDIIEEDVIQQINSETNTAIFFIVIGYIALTIYFILRKIKSDEHIDQSNSTWDLTNLNNKNRS